MSRVSTGHVASIALYSPLAAEVGANGPSAPPSRDLTRRKPLRRACESGRRRPLSPRMHVDARAGLLAEPGRGILLQDDPPDAALRSGSRARTSPRRGPCATSGRRTPGRAGAGPVGHGPNGQGTRRGHPPFGWGEQGKLVAGRYGSRLTAPRSRAKAAITEVQQGWDHRWRHHRS